MSIKLRRAGALGLAAAVVAGMAVVGATVASAASIGSLTGAPASGSTSSAFSIVTSALCPAGTDLLNAYANNAAAGWNDVLIVGANDTEIPTLNTSGVPASNTLVAIAADQTPALTVVDGTYNISLRCQQGFTTVLATFDGSLTVTGANYAFNAVAAPASTTTLTVTPPSPQNLGTSVTLNAAVTSTATVAGTVQFKSDGANLGSPVAVTAGAASLSTTALTGGQHSLTAQFIPTTPASIAGSTSAALSYTITAPAQATTTTLSSSPAAPTTADVVSLTAAVTPANAVGTVTLKEGATTVGTSAVNGGSASVSLTGLSAGNHSYTADFVPANPANFLASSATAITVPVVAFAGVSDTETLTTKVDAGTLVLTAGGPTVDLGPLALNSANSLLVSNAKDINPVTVTDTRAGNLGWNVNGVVGDFKDSANDTISSTGLGWTPKIIDSQSVQNVTAGALVAPGGSGLSTPHLLASAAPGASIGTAHLGATLQLQAPTSTKPGQYTTTLTLTAI
jgi:Bacterial Ig-like domain (group 3)